MLNWAFSWNLPFQASVNKLEEEFDLKIPKIIDMLTPH